jgi:hypothetical protein
MKRMILIIAVVSIGLLPAVAAAQSAEEAVVAIGVVQEALDDLDAAIEGSPDLVLVEEALVAVREAVDALVLVAGDLDLAALEGALVELESAVEAAEIGAIGAAFAAASAAADDVEAAAVAAAGDGTEEPTGVSTGDEVPIGPNVALLVTAGVLALLASGALVLRRTVDRR